MSGAGGFAALLVPGWWALARDAARGGVFERLDLGGKAAPEEPKTTLCQARVVFTLAHLHLATGEPRLLDKAQEVYGFFDAHLRDARGGYRLSAEADGRPREDALSRTRRAYDQSFALLALVTLRRADPAAVDKARIDSLWDFIETLTEPATGALFEDDAMAQTGARPGDVRAQNPQMHMLEALLQAYEMTGAAVWLDRAARYIELARSRLIDPETGAVREFVAHDLGALGGEAGARREPGHQYEWAWLLRRFVELGGDAEVLADADRMTAFAETFGVRCGGPMSGVPFDALDAAGRVTDDAHLLWPATEAGKLHAARFLATGDEEAAGRACALERLVFGRWFQARAPLWVNRLDGAGRLLQPEALSRLVYHVALFVTEGARAGLWPLEAEVREQEVAKVEEYE